MSSLGPTDALPGNLSEQQLFVLAYLAIEADHGASRSKSVGYTTLSWATAEEFDDDGTHIRKRSWGYRRRVLTGNHAASFSRTVKRLEERGYLERTSRIVATDKGLRAGWEAIRRHRDGRFSLSFETIE